MHTININDLDKISQHIFNKISAIPNPTLTLTKEAIIQSLGYKNLHAFQQTNKRQDVGILKHFTPREIIYLINLDIAVKDHYHDLDDLISDILSKLPLIDGKENTLYNDKFKFLKFLDNNNFTFFNYKWFKESMPKNSGGGIVGNYTNLRSGRLNLWNIIENNIPLSCLSLYNSIDYTEHFYELQAVTNKRIFTIYDFIKSYFISIKKRPFFKIALPIIAEYYALLSSISELMDNINVTDFHYKTFKGNDIESYEHYLVFKEDHLNKMAKKINKNNPSLDGIKNIFKKMFNPQKTIDIISPYDYFNNRKNFNHFFSVGGASWRIIDTNLEKNILLAKKNIFPDNIDIIHSNHLFFSGRRNGEYYRELLDSNFIKKEHFHDSWLSYDNFLYIYLIFYMLTNKDMHMNDFIYFSNNFITNPYFISYNREIVPDLLLNEYLSFLSDSLFKG